jgi:hypothetical protein
VIVAWSLAAFGADGPKCTKVSAKDLVPEETGPAIVVLGERPGVPADLDRMQSLVKTLARRAAVTLATDPTTHEMADVDTVSHVVATEVSLGTRRPADTPIAVPPLYMNTLADAMGDGVMPPELEARFVEQIAWIDHQIAATALAGWDGSGFLVILVDRLHVQGGLGVQWQLGQLTEVPIHAALLADAGTRCVAADQILKSSIF